MKDGTPVAVDGPHTHHIGRPTPVYGTRHMGACPRGAQPLRAHAETKVFFFFFEGLLKLRLAVANSDLENCTGDLFFCELELEQYIEFGVRRPAACVPCIVTPVYVPSFFMTR